LIREIPSPTLLNLSILRSIPPKIKSLLLIGASAKEFAEYLAQRGFDVIYEDVASRIPQEIEACLENSTRWNCVICSSLLEYCEDLERACTQLRQKTADCLILAVPWKTSYSDGTQRAHYWAGPGIDTERPVGQTGPEPRYNRIEDLVDMWQPNDILLRRIVSRDEDFHTGEATYLIVVHFNG